MPSLGDMQRAIETHDVLPTQRQHFTTRYFEPGGKEVARLRSCASPESCEEAFARPTAYNFQQRLAHATHQPVAYNWCMPQEVVDRSWRRANEVANG